MLNKDVKTGGGNYLTIIGGTLRQKVGETTQGAVRRDYEGRDGSQKTKFELSYNSVFGKITGVRFEETENGDQLSVKIEDGGERYFLNMGVETNFAQDFMKKLPTIDLTKAVEITPYDFVGDNDKKFRGLSIKQDGEKIKNFFYDGDNKVELHGFPKPVGDTKKFKKDDWKMHFLVVKKFLVAYTENKIMPKFVFDKAEDDFENIGRDKVTAATVEVADINPDDIPF